MAEIKKSPFEILSAIDCNEHTEKKNGLTYLSWAWAWQMVKQNFPYATYTIYETDNHIPYFTDGKTAWVKTGVTIEGIELIELLPIMDFRHKSIALENITSYDMNTAIQRSLTKACARHGLGLYIYAGEDTNYYAEKGEEEKPEELQVNTLVEARRKAKSGEKTDIYTPVKEDLYWQLIEAYAKGKLTKSGVDCKTWWINKTHADAERIVEFDTNVAQYKLVNQL